MSDDQQPFHDAPLDAAMSEALANQGLRIEQIDNATRVQNDPWLSAVARGFLEDEPVEVRREAFVGHTAHRRKLGVYDATCPQPEIPVATFASWPTELTVPGGTVQASAVSSVTVAPTHRRRGILRSVMAGELRTAASLGLPVAALTVSESTIYGRFGFGAAAAAANWEIRTRRAGWIGPEAPGRVDFVSRDQAREVAEALHERVRVTSPGEIALPGGHLNRFFGTSPDAEKAERLRTIQYRSPAGEVDGLAVYRVVENPDDFSESTLELSWLLAATDDAYAGLWRFLLEMDLIALLRASELGLDEPLWWMIADQRAAKITVTDHQYVRILDVSRADASAPRTPSPSRLTTRWGSRVARSSRRRMPRVARQLRQSMLPRPVFPCCGSAYASCRRCSWEACRCRPWPVPVESKLTIRRGSHAFSRPSSPPD